MLDSPTVEAWLDDAAWQRRLESDRLRAWRNQTAGQRAVTETLLDRARRAGCEAFALTGSTARGRRTAISDLDYHLVGPRPQFEDLPEEVDIYATDRPRLWEKLRGGDDMAQWTLRFGCILFDEGGIFREALGAVATEGIWPDPARKLARLAEHRRLAHRLIEAGDRDAAEEEVRAALSSLARARLLEAGEFPLARAELPKQLRSIGEDRLADALDATIGGRTGLSELRDHVAILDSAAIARPGPRPGALR